MSIITIDITIDDLDAALAKYDKIQVWRSSDQSGLSDPYVEITDALPRPAVVDGSIPGPWNLIGLTLSISLNGADPVGVVFTGSGPLNLEQVISQVNAVFPGLSSQIPATGFLRLTSPMIGTASSIIASGTAVAVLGLSTLKKNGKSSRPALTFPTLVYQFRDFDGSLSFWYKTRFFSSTALSASVFSVPEQGAPQGVFTGLTVSKAVVYLADGAGKPIVGRRIIFVHVGVSRVDIGSGVVYSVLPSVDRLIAITDGSGYAEMFLAIGSTYKVFFEGSTFHREIEVPVDPEFDLMMALSLAPDTFSIVQTPPMPVRVS